MKKQIHLDLIPDGDYVVVEVGAYGPDTAIAKAAARAAGATNMLLAIPARELKPEWARIAPEEVLPDDYVALGPTLEIVAFDPSYRRAKDKSIAAGVSDSLVVRRNRLLGGKEGIANGK